MMLAELSGFGPIGGTLGLILVVIYGLRVAGVFRWFDRTFPPCHESTCLHFGRPEYGGYCEEHARKEVKP
jgi:hypothetical protein